MQMSHVLPISLAHSYLFQEPTVAEKTIVSIIGTF